MRANNSIHIVTAAKQRHEFTRAKAIAALHELDRAGARISFEAVADRARVSRSWLYTQPDIKDEITRLRTQQRPRHDQAPPPGNEPTKTPCGTASTSPYDATVNSPTRTSDCAANSPTPSAKPAPTPAHTPAGIPIR